MTCRIITEMNCDECGVAYDFLAGHKSDYMRREAKRNGWSREKVNGELQDLCPTCKPNKTIEEV